MSGAANDLGGELLEAVRYAAARARPLEILGNGSKAFLGRMSSGHPISVAAHAGAVDYEPGEQVLTARCGTTLEDIDAVLAGHGQYLASEPPAFAGRATLGGTLACHLSGPSRPWSGSLRDHVLGVTMINGRAERLHFGGRVMKNVAGYDVSRLQAGAMGCYGVLTEITVRVHPRPEAEESRVFACDADRALAIMRSLSRQCSPLNGACWVAGRLYLRFAGTDAAVGRTSRAAGGDTVVDAERFWRSIAEFAHPFFAGDAPLWRWSVPAGAPRSRIAAAGLLDWGGAQRWARGEFDFGALQREAAASGGQVTLVRGGDRRGAVLPSLPPALQLIQKRLKAAFDPQNLFNRGRLYHWL